MQDNNDRSHVQLVHARTRNTRGGREAQWQNSRTAMTAAAASAALTVTHLNKWGYARDERHPIAIRFQLR